MTCAMAVIEGVGDEVTVLFGLVFMALVVVLAWASTRTVDRGDQELRPAEDTSPPTPEQQDLACSSSTEGLPNQGETVASLREAECKAEREKEAGREEQNEEAEREEQNEEREEQNEEREEHNEEREKQNAETVTEKPNEEAEKEEHNGEAEREKRNEEEEEEEIEKGNEVEEEVLIEHEGTSATEKGAVGLVTDNVPELDASPPDSVQLRQRVSSVIGREDPETLSTGDQPILSDSAEDSPLLLRLKFLNDTERMVRVRPQDTIGHIKRTHFPHQEHQVRLIYQGQLLGDDTQTLSSLNIVNNCVIHCHISQNATPQSPAGSHAAEHTETTLNIGGLMLPVFFLMLSVLWYYQINYRQFFTAPATISLVGITILFSFVAFGAYRR
uniref:transmembrane and ubiquitin-like domain-containing protein 1 n=1 Tax=Pristiophorus japonicus TaxID=55135 RepID=UPI00398E54A9